MSLIHNNCVDFHLTRTLWILRKRMAHLFVVHPRSVTFTHCANRKAEPSDSLYRLIPGEKLRAYISFVYNLFTVNTIGHMFWPNLRCYYDIKSLGFLFIQNNIKWKFFNFVEREKKKEFEYLLTSKQWFYLLFFLLENCSKTF